MGLIALLKTIEKPQNSATLLLVGLIVGAGIFGLPTAFSKSGALFGIIAWAVVTAVVLATHLMYSDIASIFGPNHRLVGDTERALGKKAALTASVLLFVSNLGALLAYMILGGNFLGAIALFWKAVDI